LPLPFGNVFVYADDVVFVYADVFVQQFGISKKPHGDDAKVASVLVLYSGTTKLGRVEPEVHYERKTSSKGIDDLQLIE
jgi:hypothetical protein